MRHRIGGSLIIIGSVGFGALLLLALAGQSVGTSENTLTGGLVFVSAACGGVGSGLLAFDASGQSEGGPGRFGLGLVAAAILGLLALQLWLTVSPIQGDLSGSPLIFVFIAGYGALLIGQVVIGVAFIARGGWRLIIGSLYLAGMVAVLLSGSSIGPSGDAAAILRVAGFASLLVGWFTLGILVTRSGEHRPQVT